MAAGQVAPMRFDRVFAGRRVLCDHIPKSVLELLFTLKIFVDQAPLQSVELRNAHVVDMFVSEG